MACRSNSELSYVSDLFLSRTLWLLSPKWKWQFHEITKVFIFFIIYWAFSAPRIKTSPLKLSVFFNLEEKLQNMVEKNFSAWKEEKKKNKNSLQSQSADLFDLRKKKQLHWKQMLTLCQLLKMERVLLSHCGYKGGIDGH